MEHHQLGFGAILQAQHKRPIFCAACLKSSQQGNDEERQLSQAQTASATIKLAERGQPHVPTPRRQRNSKRHEAEPGKQRPHTIASMSREIKLEALYQPCMSAADVKMTWSRYSSDAQGKGAPSY